MSSVYTGNPANDPASITIPRDGDGPIKAADVNPAFEGLADKIAAMKTRGLIDVVTQVYDANGTLQTWNTASYVDGAAAQCACVINGAKTGDILIVDLFAIGATSGGAQAADLRLKITDQFGGAGPVSTNPSGARTKIAAASHDAFPIGAVHVVTKDGDVQVLMQGKVDAADGTALAIVQTSVFRVQWWRAL